MKWQDFENRVRAVAALKWGVPSQPETINGVKVDCVLKIRPDYWVLIEITQDGSLKKLRTDLAKFATVRPYLMSKSIYSECHFVTESSAPTTLYTSGKGQNVEVHSLYELDAMFFDFESYATSRSKRRFGSAVDPESGKKDPRRYVPVKYVGIKPEGMLSLQQLAAHIWQGKRIVLIGNYGTGKSRCIQELFSHLRQNSPQSKLTYPIAIDLRDHWGTKRGHEILRRHFDDLGMGAMSQQALQLLEKDALTFLLDGFDEIGSQAWSDNPMRLKTIRAESLIGVKDLIQQTNGGGIITGREHYFNSETEMFHSLGLRADETVIVHCSDQFTNEEMHAYLKPVAPHVEIPSWIPRRPLVCQIMVSMGKDTLTTLNKADGSETTFWEALVSALCEREARIHLSLDPLAIRRVLRHLARFTRSQSQNVGPIPIDAINSAFEVITGHPPVDESAVMLQRLPALGRLASESTDRQFVDEYILDGLRAEDVADLAELGGDDVVNTKWVNPLGRFGLTLLADRLSSAPNLSHFYRLMKNSAARQNAILAGDILATILMVQEGALDFSGLTISDAHMAFLDLSRTPIIGLHLSQCIIDEADISECNVNEVTLDDCIILELVGVSDAQGVPSWIRNCTIERYEAVTTVSRIKRAPLSHEQRIFVTLVKKLFFQPGAGRKEEALLRGLGAAADKKTADRLLNRLLSENMVARFRGKEGWVYTPERKHAQRMNRILTELTLSKDSLWTTLK